MRYYLTFIAAVLILAACGNKKRDMLCRTWQVSDVQFINEKEAVVLSDTMKGNQIEVAKFQLRDILMKNIYEFRTDGTYITGNQSANAEGNWELTNRAIEFSVVRDGEKKVKTVEIERFDPDTLVLLMQNDQTSLKIKLLLTPLIVH